MPPGHNLPNREEYALDHRCPLHGEKAQPAVWGRHKELELFVAVRTWEILKVKEIETKAT
jgi:hypothetical protein